MEEPMELFIRLLDAQIAKLNANTDFTLEDWNAIVFSEDDLAEQLFDEDSEEFITARDMQYDAIHKHAPQ